MVFANGYSYYKPAYMGAAALTSYAVNRSSRPRRSYQRNSGPTSRVLSRGRSGGSRLSFAKRVRALAPYKHTYLNDDVYAVALTQNQINIMAVTQKVIQGDQDDQRTGDSIVPVALKVSGQFSTSATAGAYTFRMIVFWSGEEYNPIGITTPVFTSAEMFLVNSGTAFKANAIVNPKAITVLYDEVIDINSQISGVVDVKSVRAKVQLGSKKFPYQASTSVYGKVKNLYIAFIGSAVGGSAVVGNVAVNVDMVFQD